MFAANQGSSVIFLGRKTFRRGSGNIFLTWKINLLGRKSIFLGRGIISLTWETMFREKKNFNHPGEIIYLTSKMNFLGRNNISDGISEAEPGSFVSNRTAMPGRTETVTPPVPSFG